MKPSYSEQKEAWRESTTPWRYVEGKEKSQTLAYLVHSQWANASLSILELGCNVGRNLNYFAEAGYKKLAGVEVSPQAAPAMDKHFPGLREQIAYHEGLIEEVIVGFDDGEFDVVVTLAVLQHLHPESEWIFSEMARVARLGIVVIENEVKDTRLLWPRQYKDVFEKLGMKQVLEMDCSKVPLLRPHYWGRVFTKENGDD